MGKKFHGPGEKYWLLTYDPFCADSKTLCIASGVSLKQIRRLVAKLGHNDYIVVRGEIFHL